MCKIRLLRALTGNRHGNVSAASVHAELFTLAEIEVIVG